MGGRFHTAGGGSILAILSSSYAISAPSSAKKSAFTTFPHTIIPPSPISSSITSSLIKKLKRIGERVEPWRRPRRFWSSLDLAPLTRRRETLESKRSVVCGAEVEEGNAGLDMLD